MNRKFVILVIVILIILVIILTAVLIYKNIEKNLKQLAVTNIPGINLAELKDGTYTGSYKEFPVSAQVKVTIKKHEIQDIVILKHVTGQGKPGEAIIDQVKKAQSLQVDVISGATYSSKVILLAIKDALDNTAK